MYSSELKIVEPDKYKEIEEYLFDLKGYYIKADILWENLILGTATIEIEDDSVCYVSSCGVELAILV